MFKWEQENILRKGHVAFDAFNSFIEDYLELDISYSSGRIFLYRKILNSEYIGIVSERNI